MSPSFLDRKKTSLITGLFAFSTLIGSAIPFAASAVSAVPTCMGYTATVYVSGGFIVGGDDDGDVYTGTLDGGNGTNVIVGTSGDDEINGGNSADIICGEGGNDVIEGGNQSDILCGGAGNDIIDGGNGSDYLCGDDGDDYLDGSTGEDMMDGGSGFDTLDGSTGNDVCSNGEVNDGSCEDTSNSFSCSSIGGGSSSSSSSTTSSSSSSTTSSSSSSSTTSSSSSSSVSSGGSSSSSSMTSSSSSSTSTTSSSSSSSVSSGSGSTSSSSSSVVSSSSSTSSSNSGGNSSVSIDSRTTGDGSGGAFRGHRTNALLGMAKFLTGYMFGSSEGDVAPGAFGGGTNSTLSDSEVNLICSLRIANPSELSAPMQQWLAAYLATLINRDAETILVNIMDANLCDYLGASHESAEVSAADVEFTIDSEGFPVSSNATWNACVRGTVTLSDIRNNADKDEDGISRECGYYRTGTLWYHPDLDMYFGFDRTDKSVSLPSGYALKQEQAIAQQ